MKATKRAKRLADYLVNELGWNVYEYGLTKKEQKKDRKEILTSLEKALVFAQKEKTKE